MLHANVTIGMSSTPGQSFLEVIYEDIEMCIVHTKRKVCGRIGKYQWLIIRTIRCTMNLIEIQVNG